MSSYDTLHEGASQYTSFLYFYVNKKKCKKVDWKPERVVYAKGVPKERESEKIQKVDWKPDKAAYAKEEQKK